MEFESLIYVCKIFEYGTIKEVSKSIGVSKPSIINKIKLLENNIGFNIFTKSNKGMRVTEEGRRFIEEIYPLVRKYNLFVKKYNNKKIYEEVIASNNMLLAKKYFYRVLNKMDLSDLKLRYINLNWENIIDRIISEEILIGIIEIERIEYLKFLDKLKVEELEFDLIMRSKMIICFNKEEKLTDNRKINLNKLDDYENIVVKNGFKIFSLKNRTRKVNNIDEAILLLKGNKKRFFIGNEIDKEYFLKENLEIKEIDDSEEICNVLIYKKNIGNEAKKIVNIISSYKNKIKEIKIMEENNNRKKHEKENEKKKIEFKSLECIYAIYRKKSITDAAKGLYLSQPSVTKRLKKLEGIVGFKIFRRNYRKMNITKKGKIFILECIQILELYNEILKKYSEKNIDQYIIESNQFNKFIKVIDKVWMKRGFKDINFKYSLDEGEKILLKVDMKKINFGNISILNIDFEDIKKIIEKKDIKYKIIKKSKLYAYVGASSEIYHKEKIKICELKGFNLIEMKKGAIKYGKIKKILNLENDINIIKVNDIYEGSIGLEDKKGFLLGGTYDYNFKSNIKKIEMENNKIEVYYLCLYCIGNNNINLLNEIFLDEIEAYFLRYR